MAIIDLEKLLADVSPDAPCGEDVSYDAASYALETLAQGTEETQVGDSIRPAEEPNWHDVAKAASELLERTRDIRIILYLTVAALKIDGLPGLRDGLAVLRGILENHWDTVFPQLDPDDNDPIERVNLITALVQPESNFRDPMKFIRRVREAPLTDSRQLGRFSHRDLQVATGEIPPPANAEGTPPDLAQIDAAFQDTDTEFLQASAQAAAEAVEHVKGIDEFLTASIGAGEAPSLDDFIHVVQDVSKNLHEQLAKRGYGAPVVGEDEGAAPGGQGTAAPAAAAQALTGEVNSPEDVLKALEKICRYYEVHEPSSPVPLILRRAHRLVSKSFVEIIQDLSPEAIRQIEMICGLDMGAGGQ